jgi:tRNA/rRNA methyltransferase
MSSASPADIVIILAGTKHPGNIGSVARAMHNMGFRQLRLVAPQCRPDEESERMARSGRVVLEGVRCFRSIRSAARDLHFLVGTTGKTGGKRARTCSPRMMAQKIVSLGPSQKAGILFGPEDTGLVDDDLLPCQMLVRIPTHPAARSINLAQAVMILCYELFLARLNCAPEPTAKPVSLHQIEAMYSQLESALLEIGFLHPQNSQHMMFALRRLLGRAGLESEDVGMLRGVARQIAWYGKKHAASQPGVTSPEITDRHTDREKDDGLRP